MKAPDLASLQIPRARKGEAAPVEAPTSAPVPVTAPASTAGALREPGQGRGRDPDPDPDIRDFEAPREAEMRSTVSVRLSIDMQERLRHAAFKSRRRKQDIIEAALDDYLAKRGH